MGRMLGENSIGEEVVPQLSGESRQGHQGLPRQTLGIDTFVDGDFGRASPPFFCSMARLREFPRATCSSRTFPANLSTIDRIVQIYLDGTTQPSGLQVGPDSA